MAVFDLIASSYDDSISGGRFSYLDVIQMIEPFMESEPRLICDLASGTGNMAAALNERWPSAHILCQEPSREMIKILKRKHQNFQVEQTNLEQTDIINQDIITVAFNSINYLQPDVIPEVLKKIKNGLSPKGIFYFDALSMEAAMNLLQANEYIEKEIKRGELTIKHKLTKVQIFHKFSLENGVSEKHIQYLLSKGECERFVEKSGMRILRFKECEDSLRMSFVCNLA